MKRIEITRKIVTIIFCLLNFMLSFIQQLEDYLNNYNLFL